MGLRRRRPVRRIHSALPTGGDGVFSFRMRMELDHLDGLLASGVLLITFGFIRCLAHWVRAAPATPDPWAEEIEVLMQDPATPPTCLRCSITQSPGAWFCPHCGTAVGPYNNLMPYVNAFSIGEVFRSSILDRVRPGLMMWLGCVLLALHYWIVTPFYLFWVARHFRHLRSADGTPATEVSSPS